MRSISTPWATLESGFARVIGASEAQPFMVQFQVLLFCCGQCGSGTIGAGLPQLRTDLRRLLWCSGARMDQNPCQSHVLMRPCGLVSTLPVGGRHRLLFL